MRLFINLFIGFLLFFSSVVFAGNRPAYLSNYWSGDRDHYRMSLRHIEAGGIGYNNGYTTVDAFLAPTPNELTLMPFLDVRVHAFDNGNVAANLGVAFRKIIENRVYGCNVYYDYRNTDDVNYSQMGFGVEALGKRWDFRVNAYLPIERNMSLVGDVEFSEFSGNQMIVTQNYEMKGFNANFGVHFGRNKICDFYTCAGPYFFAGDLGHHIWGGKASFMVRFNKCVTIELSNSYDDMFLNRFQASVGFTIPFGSKSDEPLVDNYNACDTSDLLLSRMTQPVQRQEIIVLGSESIAIDPRTGEPFNFIFVDNTSHSLGTYESPYPTLAQAQINSKPGDIIYVFPGDGTTMGMNSGITLQQNQYFWGSGTSHILQTSQGILTVPALSSTMPIITNTNLDTELNAITLSSVNQVSGFNIVGAMNDAIFGTNVTNLSVDHCTFQGTTTYCIETTSANSAFVSVTDNVMVNNTNGSAFNFNSTGNVVVSRNSITGTTSQSSFPLTIVSGTNPLNAIITNNTINDNIAGGINFSLNATDVAQLTVSNNIINDNGFGGSQGTRAPLLIDANANLIGVGNCMVTITDNTILNNDISAVVCTNGTFGDFQMTATGNTFSGNGASGFVFDNDCTTFALTATDNIISGGGDHGITTQGITLDTATMTISNNQITDNTGFASGIVFGHDGTNLTMTLTDNNISDNVGSGFLMYSSNLIENVTMNIENNVITGNQNIGDNNAGGGIDIEQYVNLSCFLTDNTLTDNATAGLWVASTDTSVSVDLQMSGNDATITGYSLVNNGGDFYLAPCNVDHVNTGTITMSGDPITPVQSCPDDEPCL